MRGRTKVAKHSAKVRPVMPKRTLVSLEEIDERGEVLEHLDTSPNIDTSVSPELSAGDVDARWDAAESTGDETAGGSTSTPGQDVVDEIGRAIGITYEEGEPLRVGWKEEERDEHRWELDPASAEDYVERTHQSFESEPVMRMAHEDRYKHST